MRIIYKAQIVKEQKKKEIEVSLSIAFCLSMHWASKEGNKSFRIHADNMEICKYDGLFLIRRE